jgi:hypothetical protein
MKTGFMVHQQVTGIIETANDAYGDLFEACNDLYETLLNLTRLDPHLEIHRQNIPMNNGKALGLTWAAMCIKDIMRTKKFMAGITKATQACLMKTDKRPIHILYAGTGPFATLILPLIMQFTPGEVQFTLVEINPDSFQCLQTLIKKLDIGKYIYRLERADATQWRLPPNEHVDIFICETMTQGLRSEPQVAICLNIVPQLPNTCLIIPEEISLRAVLIDPKKRMANKLGLVLKDGKDEIVELGNVLALNANTIRELAASLNRDNGTYNSLPPVNIPVAPAITKTHPELYVLADVTIYKQERLLTDESALSTPLKLKEVTDETTIQLQYVLGKDPGVKIMNQ